MPARMRAEDRTTVGILAIGDEIADGRTVNGNARWFRRRFGHAVAVETGDRADEVLAAFRHLRRCRVVVVSGGLGPTADDVTRQFVCRWLKCGLAIDRGTMAKIRRKMRRLGTAAFPAGNEIQAAYPAKSTPLKNTVGGAVGFSVTVKKTQYFFLPGIPKEFRAMVRMHVAPALRRGTARGRKAVMHHFSEVAESVLDAILQERLPAGMRRAYGIYPSTRGIDVILRDADGKARAAFRKIVRGDLKPYWTYEGDAAPEDELVRLLGLRGKRLAVAESCTAGLLAATLCRVSGASRVFRGGAVCYDNDVKTKTLGVRLATLAKHGAVSAECAAEMARRALYIYGGDIGVAITGIAGPAGGTPAKPVGTVFFGFAAKGGKVDVFERHFSGDRNDIRERSVYWAIHRLIRWLTAR